MKKNIFKALICFLVFFYGKYFQYIPIFLFNIKKPTVASTALLIMFSSVLECLIIFFLFKKELKEEFSKFKKNFVNNFCIGIRYTFIGTLLMFLSNILISLFFKGIAPTNEVLIEKMISVMPLVMFIDSTFLAPFIEEITFRFSFRLLIKNKWIYTLTSGIVFGLLHIVFTFSSFSEFIYFIPYACFGCCCALMYLKTDSIFTPILMHLLYNGSLLLLGF